MNDFTHNNNNNYRNSDINFLASPRYEYHNQDYNFRQSEQNDSIMYKNEDSFSMIQSPN